MRRGSGLLGLIGLVLLAFALVAGIFTGLGGWFDRVYVLAHAGLGLLCLIAYLTTGLDNLRDFLGKRSTKYGTSTVLASVFFLGILVAVNYLSTRYHHRFDLTEQNVYSLSPQSEQVVKGLEQELEIDAFVEAGVHPELRTLLDSYRYASPRVKYRMLDPDRRPELAEKYGITAYDTVRVAYGEESTLVTQPGEESITNAIIKVTRATKKTVCFVTGHGEMDHEDQRSARGLARLQTALRNENYDTRGIVLASEEKVPLECSVLLIAGPERAYLPGEIERIEDHLRSGGAGLFLLGVREGGDLRETLRGWGIDLGQDVVVDQVMRLFQGPALGLEPIVATYDENHEITRDLGEPEQTIFPMSRSVHRAGEIGKGLAVTELAKTSPTSWAETDLEGVFENGEASRSEADRGGPISVAAAVRGDLAKMQDVEASGGETRLVVFGSSAMASNRNVEQLFNRDLLLNAVAWLVGESDLVSIRAKSLRASRLQFTQEQGALTFYLSVLILPELLLLAGVAVWWRRE